MLHFDATRCQRKLMRYALPCCHAAAAVFHAVFLRFSVDAAADGIFTLYFRMIISLPPSRLITPHFAFRR